ncbi:PQQ-dependent sugar dehydrogenase [Lignipirellula cremea]|uniref:Soluble aldose sugar dehydrogenase YliI n=1 Tax=Lignipirellula cremea TaxID=2528010 RepID=A0A518DMM0_9BACT|nr:PQQ-dependent sugar dehydrogenase [Lignipirellula cremea]QDU93087.1 Soluble aldose sugar dehydrogenase YliI precursor [Lignipirellula cremea]
MNRSCLLLLGSVFAGLLSPAFAQELQPVDTSRLIGSPDPLPLETRPAFPPLKFERPIELTFAPPGDERLFVVEQGGVVRTFLNQSDAPQSKIFLDLREKVSREGNEEGLLGFALHPQFQENGRVFVYYSTAKPQRMSIVARLETTPDRQQVDPQTETVLLKIPQPFSNHNGGSIRFGPDGYLYIGLGDGGLGNDPYGNGQDLSTLLGSILRIDVDAADKPLPYGIPADNPFVDHPQARAEIYAYGFRNVWRLSFDRETGQLWCGDVGQERYEEVNRVVRGGNHGWNLREGRHPFAAHAKTAAPLVEPVAEYFHGEGQSITGGLVYRGKKLPDFRGAYFFADYVSGFVWTVRREGDEWKMKKVADTGLAIAAFGEDRDGEMYLCAFDGAIYHLQPRKEDIEQEAAAFPQTLADTGLFASVADHQLVKGIIPYDVNVPFWSDNARKERFIALPSKASVQFSREGEWEFPVGTVLIKTFLLPIDQSAPGKPKDFRRLETRLFVHGRAGWAGYTYIWNKAQDSARLLEGRATQEFTIKTPQGEKQQTWPYPSRADCMACHSKAEKFVLGWNTLQLNRPVAEALGAKQNQIAFFAEQGFFSQDTAPSETALSESELPAYPALRTAEEEAAAAMDAMHVDRYARAWLEVNCAMCHQPDGIAGKVGSETVDLRYATPLQEMGIFRRPPGQGQLSPQGSAVLAPGDPAHSELLHRLGSRGPRQMPPLATNLPDDTATRILEQWIRSQKAPGQENSGER